MTETKEIIKEVIRYSSYTEAQKRATKKYRENNKEKVNERRKLYYQQRKEKDPAFLEYKRTKAREYYHRKREASKAKPTVEEVIETLQLSLEPPAKETIIEPVAPEGKIEKPKKTRTKKIKVVEPITPEPIPETIIEPDAETKKPLKRTRKPKLPELLIA